MSAPTTVQHRVWIESTRLWAQGSCACTWTGSKWSQPGGAIAASNEAAQHLAEASREAGRDQAL